MRSRILIVDDDQRTRSLVSGVLSREGYEVTTPADGYVGIDFALKDQYDLVLVADEMALLDGKGFLETLREADVSTPVLALSARHGEEVAKLRDAGAEEVIQKPFKVEYLLSCVSKLLGS